jgi:hypothetical protein
LLYGCIVILLVVNKKFLFLGFGIVLLSLVIFLIVMTGSAKGGQVSRSLPTATPSLFSSPINNLERRVTKKPFGIYVADRFTGFHTGVDFEITPEELNKQVLVRVICNGKLISKEYASGYGGVLVESCFLNNEPITVVYGHVKLASVKFNVDDSIKFGEVLGELGAGYSSETDGERKHLHLGIHKGQEINILGYVDSKDQLSSWINPCDYLKCK